jgi:hypothetical protein
MLVRRCSCHSVLSSSRSMDILRPTWQLRTWYLHLHHIAGHLICVLHHLLHMLLHVLLELWRVRSKWLSESVLDTDSLLLFVYLMW